MPRYSVTFYKNLLSSNGHPFKCAQQIIMIDAANAAHAVAEATEQFERRCRIRDWRMNADTVETRECSPCLPGQGKISEQPSIFRLERRLEAERHAV